MDYIEQSFKSYLEMVYPEPLPEYQYTEVRRAFYAGAQGFFYELMTVVDHEELTMTIMSEIASELERFLELIRAGEA